jgi:uncharacterized protein (DUF1778 family)
MRAANVGTALPKMVLRGQSSRFALPAQPRHHEAAAPQLADGRVVVKVEFRECSVALEVDRDHRGTDAPSRPHCVSTYLKSVPIAKPRNRIVVFRLTQEEYRLLQEACRAKGGRNLSDFTRSELMGFVKTDRVLELVQERFRALEESLLPLQRTLARAMELLGSRAADERRRNESDDAGPQ